jgi:hypothetical protein
LQDIGEETRCLFSTRESDSENGGLPHGPSLGIEDVYTAFFEPTSSDNGLKFWPWINEVCCRDIFAAAYPEYAIDANDGLSATSARDRYAAVQANWVHFML